LATRTRFPGTLRVDCDALRLTREDVFLVFRLMPAALFFDRWRVFSATALAWISRLYWRFLGNAPRKNKLPADRERHIGGVLHYEMPLYHIFSQNQSLMAMRKRRMPKPLMVV